MAWSTRHMAARAAAELREGQYVNLGVGIPTLIPAHVSEALGVTFHAENGILGLGGPPTAGSEDPDLIDAARRPTTVGPGASFFDSVLSFAIARGGHLDMTVLGGMQVSSRGDLANWSVPGQLPRGVGGAMDLVTGADRVVVVMKHRDASGISKVVGQCTFPLTGAGVVTRLITDLAVIDPAGGAFRLIELAPGVTEDFLLRATDATIVT